jgi:hypothetical protein
MVVNMNKYEAAIAKILRGRKIVDVQFSEGFPILVFDNDVCAVVMCDDEGNGPGAISFQLADGTPVDIWGK